MPVSIPLRLPDPPDDLLGGDAPDEARLAAALLRAGVLAVRPQRCLPAALSCVSDGEAAQLQCTDVSTGAVVSASLPGSSRVALLCIGKCGLGAALTLRRLLGERVGRAVVVDRDQDLSRLDPADTAGLEFFAGDHPLATERSLAAGRRVRDFVASLLPGELLLCCLSGGASALLELPAREVPVEWLASVPAALMRAGADVQALLAVRAAMSALKCGGLLDRLPRGVPHLVLVLSDVAGDDPAQVAGAPFYPPLSGHLQGLLDQTLDRFGAAMPEAVRQWLSTTGRRRLRPKHVQPGPHVVVATNGLARQAALRFAHEHGLSGVDLGERYGTPAEVASALLAFAASGEAAVGLMGGEAVAEVRGTGRGGRNLEVVALCLPACAAGQMRAVGSIDTDGIDGSTELAGAVAWPAMAGALVEHAAEALRLSNSGALFAGSGGLKWGPTGANVSDLRVVVR